MFIWILAVLLLGLFAALGYVKGAVRTAVSTLGLLLGLLLAKPLAPMVQPLLPHMGVKHPLWLTFLPVAVVFLLIWFVAIGLSFLVHRKAYLYYKYKTDDVTRLRWERMNQGVGVAVGVLSGVIYFFIFSWIIYVAGYLTVQVSAEETPEPAMVKFLNEGRKGLQKTGLDKTVASLDRTNPRFYEIADILGLLYQNPVLQSRLNKYPPFLTLGERPEFVEIGNDKDFSELLLNKGSVAAIVNHPRFQALIANTALMDELKASDLPDLRHYLETGKSKFDEEKILGRWNMDADAVLTDIRKAKPDMTAQDMLALRKATAGLAGVSMTATVDNKTIFKLDSAVAAAAQAAVNPPAAAPGAPAAPGNRGGRPPAQPRNGPGAKPPQNQAASKAISIPVPSGEGAWKFEGDKYVLSFTDTKGKKHSFAAQIDEGELMLTEGELKLIFWKAE